MIQYKVLIIEDDLNAAQSISNFLSAWGFQCEYLKDFGQVTDQFISFRPEIVLLDITLPHYNGYHWCEEIRKISKVPIIFISSINDNLNMILAMNMGGDDFVVKPFDLNFLLAKINSLLRRTYDFQGAMNVVACGDVVLDLDNAKLQYKGRILELSRNDFIILKELMTHSGKNVSRDELMQALWNDNTFVDDNTLTGALDSRSSAQVMKMFTDIHRTGQTILVVTHSVKTACYAGRVLFIRDGRLFNQLYRGDMDNEAFQEKISDNLKILLQKEGLDA